MGYIFVVLLSLFLNTSFAQDISNEILSSEILDIKNPTDESLKEIRIIYSNMEAYNSNFKNEIMKYYKINNSTDNFKYDNKKQFKFIENYVLSKSDEIVKQYAAMQIPTIMMNGFHPKNIDTDTKKVILSLLKPDDIMWSLDTHAILFFSNWNTNIAIRENIFSIKGFFSNLFRMNSVNNSEEIALNKAMNFFLPIYAQNPNRGVKAAALANYVEILYLFDKREDAADYYAILEDEFYDVAEIEHVIERYAPNRPTAIGKEVPLFSGIDSKSLIQITPDIFNGKYYLIQFWSITCPPCVAEMDEIHEVYKKYKDKNFTILSFSMGDSKERLEKFWNEKWQMPWYNVSLKNGWKDRIAKDFSVVGIPTLLLIAPNGSIIENNLTLRSKSIDEVILKHLKL